MKISARVTNSLGQHHATVTSNGRDRDIPIPPRDSGYGSSINGGELLFLAMATCYCNDLYREAAKRDISVHRVEVHVEGDFGAEGEPATNVRYRARVEADASETEIRNLMLHTDTVAEIQNTLRGKTPVALNHIEAITVPRGTL